MFISFCTKSHSSYIIKVTTIEKIFFTDNADCFYIHFSNGRVENFVFDNPQMAKEQFISIKNQLNLA